MHREARFHNSIFGVAWNSALAFMIVLLVLLAVVLFIAFTAQPAEGQTYRVIYNLTGGADGASPNAGLAMDALGNLYGVTPHGGLPTCRGGCGTVFELAHLASGWALVSLYRFQGGTDGYYPSSTLAFGPDGDLYGTTADSDLGCDLRRMEGISVQQDNCSPQCGTVFKVARPNNPPPGVFAGWQHTKLYRFQGPPDGNRPYHSPVTFDSLGDI